MAFLQREFLLSCKWHLQNKNFCWKYFQLYTWQRKRHAFRVRRNGFFGGGNFLFRISELTQRERKCSFRKLQIFISQTTDSHFANYRFSFRKLQISISRTTDFHFVSSHFVSFHFVSQTTVSQKIIVCYEFSWNTHRLAAMFPYVAIQACLLVASPFRVYAKLKKANGKRQTSASRLPFAVNAMLNLNKMAPASSRFWSVCEKIIYLFRFERIVDLY